MKPKTLALLCVAVGCGLVAMIGVQQAMNNKSAARVEMVPVLEALADIDPGVPLSEENVAFKEIAKNAVPEDAVTNIEEYQKRSLTVAVVKGEYILKSKLSEPGVSGKSTQIPIGKSIVTINVDETQTHSNMMKAGDIVDVAVTYDARTPTGVQTKTMTLLERVTVFAIADQTKNDMERRTDNNSIKARQVSLIVNHDEVNSALLAERKGQLRLVWRNPTDTELHNSPAITEGLLKELQGLDLQGSRQQLAIGESNPPERPVVEKEAAPAPDVDTFLAQPSPPQQPIEKPESAPPTDKPVWEVKVYVGNDVQSYAFDLPEAAASADAAAGLPGNQTAAGLLQKFGWSLPWKASGTNGSNETKTNQAL